MEKNLKDADLSGRDLSGEDLSDADLQYVNLEGADLQGADRYWLYVVYNCESREDDIRSGTHMNLKYQQEDR